MEINRFCCDTVLSFLPPNVSIIKKETEIKYLKPTGMHCMYSKVSRSEKHNM